MDDFLKFDRVTKSYGSLKAVDDVTLTIKRGEIFSILGPSGCGKTTLLRMLAGFDSPDCGRILLDGEDITEQLPNIRKVNTVFQNYALFPHMTVRENIAFGQEARHDPDGVVCGQASQPDFRGPETTHGHCQGAHPQATGPAA